jgi:hypothetical protein
MYQDEEAIKKPGVKLSKEKRSKKLSIYDVDDIDEIEKYKIDDDLDFYAEDEYDDLY